MVITNFGLSGVALRIGSNVPVVAWLAVGSGSGTVAVGQSGLIVELDRNAFTSTDFSVQKQFAFQADFSATEMSGINLTEFGVFNNSAASSGTAWQIERFPSVAFAGSTELQVNVIWEVF